MQNEKSWHSIQDETTVTDVLKMAVLLISVLTGLAGTIAFCPVYQGSLTSGRDHLANDVLPVAIAKLDEQD